MSTRVAIGNNKAGGEHLRELREKRGFASRADVERASEFLISENIRELESGIKKSSPKFADICELSRIYRVTLDEIGQAYEYRFTPCSPVTEPMLLQLASVLEQSSPSSQAYAMRALESIVEELEYRRDNGQ